MSDTEGQSESQASAVPEKATQGAEIQGRNWSWVEATVWNERMLAALGNGVKGDMLSSLPKGCSPWLRPVWWRANPDEETTDWRAVCGRTARTVRRAGTAKAVSDRYHKRSADFFIEFLRQDTSTLPY